MPLFTESNPTKPPPMTALDQFCNELHLAADRMARPPVACAIPAHHPMASTAQHQPSVMGLAACYDPALSTKQGVIFFSDLEQFNRYRSAITP